MPKRSRREEHSPKPAAEKEGPPLKKAQSKGTTNVSKKLGSVLTLGLGDLGQLGLGEDKVERKRPTPVGGVLKDKITQVVCGGIHTIALADDGQVFTWGCNDEGALGRSIEDVDEYTPGPVVALKNVCISQVSAGDCHTTALAEDGSVYFWGTFRDADGPFGPVHTTPQVVYNSTVDKAVKVMSGANHVLILTESGKVNSFGCAENGQLGRVSEYFSVRGGRRGLDYLLTPQVIEFPLRKEAITNIFTGEHTSYAIGDNGLYAWGLNHRGQLGTNNEVSQFVPEDVAEKWPLKRNDRDVSISAGGDHTLLCNNGMIYAMGSNDYGQLGLPKEVTTATTPTQIKGLDDKVVSVACGGRTSFAVTKGGAAYSWGIGSNSQLGCGQGEDIFTPTPMEGKQLQGQTVMAVSSGGQHTALLVCSNSNS